MVNKKFFAVLGATALLIILGAGCGKGTPTSGGPEMNNGEGSSLITDMCSQFSPEWIKSAIDKVVVKTETRKNGIYCHYYTEYSEDFYKLSAGKSYPGGPWFALNYEVTLPVANQKKGHEIIGHKIETNSKIGIEHFIAVQEDDLINEIFLVLGDKSFVSISRSSGTVLNETEFVDFAAAVGKALTEGVPPPKLSLSQVETARNFFTLLSEKKIDEALAVMDADQNTKQMWRVNFRTIQFLQIKNVEPAFEEEWISTRQTFKAELDVKVTSEGENYGWSQGQNTRWVSLQKNGDIWQVHELASNP